MTAARIALAAAALTLAACGDGASRSGCAAAGRNPTYAPFGRGDAAVIGCPTPSPSTGKGPSQ